MGELLVMSFGGRIMCRVWSVLGACIGCQLLVLYSVCIWLGRDWGDWCHSGQVDAI